MGEKIKYVDKKINGEYWGMNSNAAKELGINFPYPKDTLLIYNGLSKKDKKQTIIHEKVESHLMEKGMKYQPAHKIAEKIEDIDLCKCPSEIK